MDYGFWAQGCKGLCACFAAGVLLAFGSCTKVELSGMDECGESEVLKDVREVRFEVYGFRDELETRATLAEGNVTDLYVFDGGVEICHQVSTDEDFGSPTVTLSYDSHALSFVATSGVTSVSEGVLSWSNSVKEMFGKTMVIVVDGKTQAQSVELGRLNAKFKLTIQDVIPNDAATVKIGIPSAFGISTATLNGGDVAEHEYSANISSWAGKANKYINITLVAPDGERFSRDVSVKFYDSEGEVISQISKTCTFQRNRTTNLYGNCFNTNPLGALTLNTVWGDEIEERIQ